jgi:hypothetical protein
LGNFRKPKALFLTIEQMPPLRFCSFDIPKEFWAEPDQACSQQRSAIVIVDEKNSDYGTKF